MRKGTLTEVEAMRELWSGRLAERYATCASYTDRGRVFLRDELIGRFETTFDRASNAFAFDFEFDERMEIGGSRRGSARAPDDLPALTGITFGAAHTVPKLLWPDRVWGRSLEELLLHSDIYIEVSPSDGTLRRIDEPIETTVIYDFVRLVP